MGTYAWAECHESVTFFFEVERVLDGQSVHGCFGDLVSRSGEVMGFCGVCDGG